MAKKLINPLERVVMQGTGKGAMEKGRLYKVHPETANRLAEKGVATIVKGKAAEETDTGDDELV